MSKIILTADCNFEDKKLREYVNKLETKIETLNDRTKIHTLEIRQLKKDIKNANKRNS